jgi:inner membrane protein
MQDSPAAEKAHPMPTVFTHAAVPLAVGLGLGRERIPVRLLALGVAASVVPDLDSVVYRLGVPYEVTLGHRGVTHSLVFAVGLALLGACAFRLLRTGFGQAFWFLLLAAASHGLLDACTTGGYGVTLLWPWSTQRYAAPLQVIEVAPLTLSRLLSPRGATVLASELRWVWLPCALAALGLAAVRWYRGPRPASAPRRRT